MSECVNRRVKEVISIKGGNRFIYEKIINRRSIRRYKNREMPKEVLIRCMDATRLSPSTGNHQLLKYIVVDKKGL